MCVKYLCNCLSVENQFKKLQENTLDYLMHIYMYMYSIEKYNIYYHLEITTILYRINRRDRSWLREI